MPYISDSTEIHTIITFHMYAALLVLYYTTYVV